MTEGWVPVLATASSGLWTTSFPLRSNVTGGGAVPGEKGGLGASIRTAGNLIGRNHPGIHHPKRAACRRWFHDPDEYETPAFWGLEKGQNPFI